MWTYLLKGKEAGPPTRAVNIIRFISKIKNTSTANEKKNGMIRMTETRSTLDSGQKGWEYVLKNE